MTQKERYNGVLQHFIDTNANDKPELIYRDEFSLLVAVILSAQCTDKRVNMVTPALIDAYPTAEAMAKAGAVLLEPIMKVDVTVPEDHMGDVIGDLNARRGRVEGMENIPGGTAMIHAMVPLAEMFGYSTALRSRTQGRGVYSMQPAHYEPVPKSIQEKVCGTKAAK